MEQFFSPQVLIEVISLALTGVGVYAAIRSDLKALHVEVSNAKASATRANDRLDQLARDELKHLRAVHHGIDGRL